MNVEVQGSEPLPDVFSGELDGSLFEDYFADLEELADVRSVLVKNGPEVHAEGTRLTLDQARMLLVLGQVRGVQLHYLHDGLAWVDTLVRQPDSVRLVRMRAPEGPSEPTAPASRTDGKRRLRVLPQSQSTVSISASGALNTIAVAAPSRAARTRP